MMRNVLFLNDPSLFVVPYLVDKQGYIFNNDDLPTLWVKDMIINHNINYMYSDSRLVDERADIQQLIDTTLLSVGSVKVFKFKKE